MRKMFATLFVVLALLASAVPASAQAIRWGGYIPQTPDGWYYLVNGDQVGMLTADNLGLVSSLSSQLPRSLTEDLIWNGSAYGLMASGGFYPMYDRQMRPMSRRAAIITGAVVGAGLGYGFSGNARVAAVGAGVGALIGFVTHRGNGGQSRDNTVVTPPSERQPPTYWSHGAPVPAVDQRTNQRPVSNPPSIGEWRVTNRTSKRAELWDGEQFIARIEPWQSVPVDAPQNGFKAVLLIPNRSGGLERERAQIRASNNFNGWDIVAPAVQ